MRDPEKNGSSRGKRRPGGEAPSSVRIPARPSRRRRTAVRRALKRLGWNAVWLAAGLALIAATGEVWRRVTTPFAWIYTPRHFVPDVGRMLKPHTQVRYTNRRDFWTTARTNRFGFLDREPPNRERAAESCHVAVIGDSFVAAMEVPIADKMQVRLEELAERRLPELDLTASAYGIFGTGQVNQLPLYDEYARRLRPKLVVLVFAPNDYTDNFGELRALLRGYHPERFPYLAAFRNPQGALELRPPSADYEANRPRIKEWHTRWVFPLRSLGFSRDLYLGDTLDRLLDEAARVSYFVSWLGSLRFRAHTMRDEYFEMKSGDFDHLVDDWSWLHDAPSGMSLYRTVNYLFRQAELPRFLERALDYTAFSLDQFRRRAERDSFPLAILSIYYTGTGGNPPFDRMHGMAEARGIPVIDQYDWIVRQGRRVEEAHFPQDYHWNADGHRWAAEALLDWIERNQDVCRPGGDALRSGS